MKPLILGMLLGTLAQAANLSLSVPFFKQQKNGCGAASVAMVMHYWGRQRSEARAYPDATEVYRSLFDAELQGIPLGKMKQYLEAQGFRAFTLRGNWSDLEQHLGKGRPVIVTLKKNASSPLHYAVVTGTTEDHVLLNDPTKKRTARMKQAEFAQQWNQADRWMLLAVPQE